MVLLGWAVLAVALAVAFWRRLRPAWTLALLAFVFSVAVFAEEIVAMGAVPNRYLVAPAALLVTTVVALIRPDDTALPRDGRARPSMAWAPVAAFLVLVAGVALVNYRVPENAHELDAELDGADRPGHGGVPRRPQPVHRDRALGPTADALRKCQPTVCAPAVIRERADQVGAAADAPGPYGRVYVPSNGYGDFNPD
jgi:hypothetical protein